MAIQPETRTLSAHLSNILMTILGVFLLIGLLSGFFILGANLLTRKAAAAPQKGPQIALELLPAEANQRRSNGALILDLSTIDEWREIHVPGAMLIPVDQLKSRMNEVPRDREVILICRTSVCAENARDMLRAAGFPKVASVMGGIWGWASANLPIMDGP